MKVLRESSNYIFSRQELKDIMTKAMENFYLGKPLEECNQMLQRKLIDCIKKTTPSYASYSDEDILGEGVYVILFDAELFTNGGIRRFLVDEVLFDMQAEDSAYSTYCGPVKCMDGNEFVAYAIY